MILRMLQNVYGTKFYLFFEKLNMLKGAHIKWEHVSFDVLMEKKMICSLLTNIFFGCKLYDTTLTSSIQPIRLIT